MRLLPGAQTGSQQAWNIFPSKASPRVPCWPRGSTPRLHAARMLGTSCPSPDLKVGDALCGTSQAAPAGMARQEWAQCRQDAPHTRPVPGAYVPGTDTQVTAGENTGRP